MEVKYRLLKPYSEDDRENFIVKYNHNQGYIINETETELQALGYTEEEMKEKEKEHISHLKCTKRVLALMLQQLGIAYSQLKELIASNEQAQLEWDLCVELERSNPLLDILGAQLGLAPTTIDKIFKYANGEISKEDVDETDMVKGGIANG